MRWALTGGIVLICLTACGGNKSQLSSLQRYQTLAAGLRTTSSITAAVAADLHGLSARMRVADGGGTQAYAGRLAWDSHRLASSAGSEAAPIRSIARRDANGVRTRYFALVLDALVDEWAEASYLSRLATLAWWDPNVIRPGHTAELARLETSARWEAWQSVVATRAAERWRSAHQRSFRYVVVKQAPAA